MGSNWCLGEPPVKGRSEGNRTPEQVTKRIPERLKMDRGKDGVKFLRLRSGEEDRNFKFLVQKREEIKGGQERESLGFRTRLTSPSTFRHGESTEWDETGFSNTVVRNGGTNPDPGERTPQ